MLFRSNGSSFADALAEAQRLGYAEANPGFDIDGMDSLHKVALLASLIYGRYVDYRKLSVEGIRNVSALDIRMADEMGYEVKLLGAVSQKDGKVLAAVYPAMLERGHQLASVSGVLNGVYLKASAAGAQLFTGAGAGRYPTASAVISDLVALARQKSTGNPVPFPMAFFSKDNEAELLSIDELETELVEGIEAHASSPAVRRPCRGVSRLQPRIAGSVPRGDLLQRRAVCVVLWSMREPVPVLPRASRAPPPPDARPRGLRRRLRARRA